MKKPFLATGSGLTDIKLRNSAGEKIGEIIEWIMDAEEGKVMYVVVRSERSEDFKCLPWPLMKVDRENGGYLIENQSDLDEALEIEEQEITRLTERKELVAEIYNKTGVEDSLPATYTKVHQEGTERSPEDVEQKGYGGRDHPEKFTTKNQ